jgi:hypothetical protein
VAVAYHSFSAAHRFSTKPWQTSVLVLPLGSAAFNRMRRAEPTALKARPLDFIRELARPLEPVRRGDAKSKADTGDQAARR